MSVQSAAHVCVVAVRRLHMPFATAMAAARPMSTVGAPVATSGTEKTAARSKDTPASLNPTLTHAPLRKHAQPTPLRPSSSNTNDWISDFAAETISASQADAAANANTDELGQPKTAFIDWKYDSGIVSSADLVVKLLEENKLRGAYSCCQAVLKSNRASLARLSPEHFAKLMGAIAYNNNLMTGDLSYRSRSQYMFELFDVMVSLGIKPDRAAFTYRIEAFGRLGMLPELEKAIAEMDSAGMTTDTHAIHSAHLMAFIFAGKEDDAKNIFQKMLQKDSSAWTYNCLMGIYSFTNQETLMLELFEDMKKNGPQPNSFTYNCLCNLYFNRRDYLKVRQIIDEVKKEMTLPTPMWNKLLAAANRTGDHRGAIAIVSEMRILRVPFNRITQIEEFVAHCRTKNRSMAWRLLVPLIKTSKLTFKPCVAIAQLEGPATDPDVLHRIKESVRVHRLMLIPTLTSFIVGYSRLGDAESVQRLITECELVTGKCASTVMYTNIIRAYRHAGNLRNALDVIKELWRDKQIKVAQNMFYAMMMASMEHDPALFDEIVSTMVEFYPDMDVDEFVRVTRQKYEAKSVKETMSEDEDESL